MKTIIVDLDSNENLLLDVQNHTISLAGGDTQQRLCLSLYQCGQPWPIPKDAALSLWYSGPSGDGNYTHVNGESAFIVEENRVTVTPAPEMIAVGGSGMMCLMLHTADGNQRKMWNLVYTVEGVPGSGSHQIAAYFSAFSGLIKQAQEFVQEQSPDDTLSQSGKAADAAATGAALAAKAPAGFGLGGSAQNLPRDCRLSDYADTGFYYWDQDLVDPDKPFTAGSMAVIKRSNSYFHQIAFRDDVDYSSMCIRKMTGGALGEWEWINPPMLPSTEYRTTERFLDRAVYCIAITGTALEGSNYATLPISIAAGNLVSITGHVGDYPAGTASAGSFLESSVSIFYNNWIHDSVGFHCGQALAGQPYRFLIKYTK